MPVCLVCHKAVSKNALKEAEKLADFDKRQEARSALYLNFILDHAGHNPKWAKRWLRVFTQEQVLEAREARGEKVF